VSTIEDQIARYYGEAAVAELPRATGLIHVASIWTGPEAARGSWPAILIRADSPRSPADRFALELARARADAIVISGQIIRDEPTLRYDRPGAGTDYAAELLRWREQTLAKPDPPRLLVLTRSACFDLDHPVFHGWARPLIATSRAGAERLARELEGRELELVADPAPSLAAAVEHLRGLGCETISLEAGPSVLAPVYAGAGPALDELMLSLYAGPLAPALRGPSFADPAEVERLFEQLRATPAGGDWTLTRWRRRASARSHD